MSRFVTVRIFVSICFIDEHDVNHVRHSQIECQKIAPNKANPKTRKYQPCMSVFMIQTVCAFRRVCSCFDTKVGIELGYPGGDYS